MDHTQNFLQAMTESGVICRETIVADGVIHRFATDGRGDRDGWYVFYGDAGAFGVWGKVDTVTWSSGGSKTLSPDDRRRMQEEIARAKIERDKEIAERQETIALEAQAQWERLADSGESPYLLKKQVGIFDVRFGSGFIAVPMRDADGKLWSLQHIFDDGTKRFLLHGRKKGCFHTIGLLKDGEPLYICEGYATGMTVHMATGLPVVVAFDAGNLLPVVEVLRQKYPQSTLTIAADNDQWKERNAGREKAEEAAIRFGCNVILPEFSESIKKDSTPTDWNDLHCLEGLDTVKAQLLPPAPIIPPSAIIPDRFRVNKAGVYYVDADPEKDAIRLCSPLYVEAFTHDQDDRNYGRLLCWETPKTGQPHQWALPCRMLAGDGTEIIARLLDEGLEVTPGRKAREKLLEYIQCVQPTKSAISLSRIGWHDAAFALPDIVYPDTGAMVLQTEGNQFHTFQISGTLKEWQDNVAWYAAGNSRLIFALASAFTPPLLHIAKEESGALHFIGASSLGKTSALRIAASVWGGGGENGFIKQWRATGNALESIAESHRDCLLPLDELGQADSKTVGDTVYMLANNQGKGRMQSSTAMRQTFEWRVLVLSSGEVTLESKMAEAGKRPMAGMEVRFVNIPAEVAGAYGIFEHLHGFENGDSFSRHLKETCSQYYGVAIRTYLKAIAGNAAGLADAIKHIQQEFNQRFLPTHANGQVKRVAGRFGLIAAGGELAIDLGILPLTSGEAIQAAGRCFTDWLEQRGTTGGLEMERGITQIRSFFERFGASRFVTLDESGAEVSDSIRPIDRMGYRERRGSVYHYYVLKENYTNELCKGHDARLLTRALVERGYLLQDSQGKNQVTKRFPGCEPMRVYHFSPAILADQEQEAAA